MLIHMFYNIFGIGHYILINNITEETFNEIKSFLFFIHFIYFFTDSIVEYIYHQRFTYIIHHTLSIFQVGLIKYSSIDFIYLKHMIELYGIIEITSLIVNIRDMMKTHKILNLKYDFGFIIVYFIIRALIFPYYIFYILNNNAFLMTIPTIIYILSQLWLFNWIVLYTKRLKKMYIVSSF